MSAPIDEERRFGALRRLYGGAGYTRLRKLHVAVVGLGGVGSWAVEALARCGVAALTLVDLDHVAESNINRQLQAHSGTLGQHKGEALRERIALIHPGCRVSVIDAFVEPGNWASLIDGGAPLHGLIDACDQVRAKAELALWARGRPLAFVCVGAAGGKQRAEGVRLSDLSEVTHDPLLASLRARLRREGAPRQGPLDVCCVHSLESVRAPAAANGAPAAGLQCAGYGSSVMVTASFGMAAASALVTRALDATSLAEDDESWLY